MTQGFLLDQAFSADAKQQRFDPLQGGDFDRAFLRSS
jgi:hypothetical protein